MPIGPYKLTPADIMNLRESVRWRLTDTIDGPSVPFICYASEDRMAQNAPGYDPDAFVLHTEGHMRAISPRIEVLAACLRCEFAEPGFVSRILNPREDCHVASLAPDEAAAARSRRLFEEKAIRTFAAEEGRRAARKPMVRLDDTYDPHAFAASLLEDDD